MPVSARYAAIIAAYALQVPLPERCALISSRHKRYETAEWLIFTPRHQAEDTLAGQLTFALKNEGLDLAVLSALFAHIDAEEIAAWVRMEPTGSYSRRIWFLYEWLTQRQLALPDAQTGKFITVLNEKQQYPGHRISSKRHRVYNNLPGVRNFCPLIRRTDVLERYVSLQLGVQAYAVAKETKQDVLTRAAAFLLLKDSRASFAIEREEPSQERAERWGQVLRGAGLVPLTKDEMLRLQGILLEGNRFVALGFRQEGGFIGLHDRVTGSPVPDHISARWQDLAALINGLIDVCAMGQKSSLDPVMLAAVIAFGFVFIHPFVDGNGRLHRYLMQHIIVACGFVPSGMVLPLSAVILERIDEYKQVLEIFLAPDLAV